MFCQFCGFKFQENSGAFCGKCGARKESPESAAAPSHEYPVQRKRKGPLIAVSVTIIVAVVAALVFVVMRNDSSGWSGNVFSSRSLGLEFVMPHTWNALSHEELQGLGAIVGHHDANFYMAAVNPNTGANVNIVIERLPPANRQLTAAEYLDISHQQLRLMGGRMYGTRTVRVGRYDWLQSTWSMTTWGMTQHGRSLVHMQNGYARVITITTFPNTESAEEILNMFRRR